MGVTTAEDVASLQELWVESHQAELAGRITRALEIHEQILSRIGTSYAAYLRAGWLHYQAGGYRRSMHFYVTAMLLSPEDCSPLYGMRNCYAAMGDAEAVARITRVICTTDERGVSRDHQFAV